MLAERAACVVSMEGCIASHVSAICKHVFVYETLIKIIEVFHCFLLVK